MLGWLVWSVMLLAVGFTVGALSMVLLGWEPLLRGAVRVVRATSRKKHDLVATRGNQVRFTSLSQSLVSHPVRAADILAIAALASKQDLTDVDSGREGADLKDLSIPLQVTELNRVVDRLLGEALGASAQLQIINTALSRDDVGALRTSFLCLTKPTSRIFRTTLLTLRVLVQRASDATPSEGSAYAAAMAQFLGRTFGPTLQLDSIALTRLLQDYETIMQRMLALEAPSETLRAYAAGPALHVASAEQIAPPPIDVAWTNAVLSRWFQEYASMPQLVAVWEASANRLLQKQALPGTIETLALQQLTLGASPPCISSLALVSTHAPDELCLAFTLDYTGDASVEVHTSVPVSDFKAKVSMRVRIKSFRGRLRLLVPPARADPGHGWVAFEEPPTFALSIESCQHPPQALPQLAKLVSLEILESITVDATLPHWTYIELPWHPATSSLDTFFVDLRAATGTPTSDASAKSFVETAGGLMGSAVGSAFGGAFGGKVARAVGEKMGEHLAKYATSTLSPVVHDVVATAKSFRSPKHKPTSPTTTSAPTERSISADKLVALARKASHVDTKEPTPHPVSAPNASINVAQLVSRAKQTANKAHAE
ncbi:hypothetical protein SDRG_03384 [Saprolegnia diclina VS20]|uniref:SMP-LTD domain-containing protein n=1 Tax=Saprolegnia diclina (strain VS20) TaxID=1156394 RepID=T0S2H8_SAPDV|nr:hypothetical protein SDRG_03384 [Saprolegnia diclina VS20]EQC39178.1 hypothetical protein SDRG_03384 [Saprolegnia diclina VS20]|eukprot:XP_008607239.1 hypothetical protein SDRG_03384 [Saprolegnia diclina VS20]